MSSPWIVFICVAIILMAIWIVLDDILDGPDETDDWADSDGDEG